MESEKNAACASAGVARENITHRRNWNCLTESLSRHRKRSELPPRRVVANSHGRLAVLKSDEILTLLPVVLTGPAVAFATSEPKVLAMKFHEVKTCAINATHAVVFPTV